MTKLVVIFLVVVLLVVWAGMFVRQEPGSTKEISFVVERGSGTRDIALHLEQQGLIPSAPLFRLFVLTTGIAPRLQAGKYLFSAALTPFEISRKLAAGDVVKERITIVEGWTVQDIAQYLQQRDLFLAQEVLAYTDLEGYLFPDTYLLYSKEELGSVIQRMLDNFDAKVTTKLREEIKKQGKTLSDIVVMASLLEKELKTLEDKKIAADVLWKRLDIGMPLQVDASPITYEEPGLPKRPIANPGFYSIEAAIYPTKSSHWYYLSTPEGETIFSRTLEEHNTAKAQHLR